MQSHPPALEAATGSALISRPKGLVMQRIELYLRCAEECRSMAAHADTEEHRAAIEKLREAWLALAADRRKFLDRKATATG
jgi:hypothetical protein